MTFGLRRCGARVATVVAVALIAIALALVSLPQSGPDTASAGGTATPTPSPGDLAVTKTDSADPVESNVAYTYTITITNIGPGPVGGQIDQSTGEIIPVGLIDRLPSSFIATGFTVDFDGVCLLFPATELSCDFGQFLAGQSATVTITGHVVSSSTITVENLVVVDLPISLVAETIEVTNNFASQSTTIMAPADPTSAELVVKTGAVPCPPSSTADYCIPAGGAFTLSAVLTGVPEFGYYGFYTHIDYGGLTYKPTPDFYDEILWPDFIFAGRVPDSPSGAEGSVEHGATKLTAPLGPPSFYLGALVELALNCTSGSTTGNVIDLLPDLSSVTIVVGPSPVAEQIALSDAISVDCVGPSSAPTAAPTPASVGGVSFAPPGAGAGDGSSADGSVDTATLLVLTTGAVAIAAAGWHARRRMR
jgi:hypothetical protein